MELGTATLQFVDVSFKYWINTYFYSVSQAAVCPTLGNPTNGVAGLSGTSVGDTATYTCDSGYELVGLPVLTCQDDGTWDNSPPICRREFQ